MTDKAWMARREGAKKIKIIKEKLCEDLHWKLMHSVGNPCGMSEIYAGTGPIKCLTFGFLPREGENMGFMWLKGGVLGRFPTVWFVCSGFLAAGGSRKRQCYTT